MARPRKIPPKSNDAEGSDEPNGGERQRLQRVLASAGWGSRRQCEQLIVDGRVEVDGKTVDQLGATVDPKKAEIYVDGERLKQAKLRYYLVNKPVGVVTTNRDPQGRPRVIDLVPDRERVFPVGRLDRASEGLILVTNDGELAQRLAHPRYGVTKTYLVTVAGEVPVEVLERLRKGVHLAEGMARVEHIKVKLKRKRATDLEIVLREGKNREIRRILARVGHKVLHLKRVALGPMRLGNLEPGEVRMLTPDDIARWLKAIEVEARQHGRRGQRTDRPPSAHPRSAARAGGSGPPEAGPPTRSRRAPPPPPIDQLPAREGTLIGADDPDAFAPPPFAAGPPSAGHRGRRPPGKPPRAGHMHPPNKTGRAPKRGKRGLPPHGGRAQFDSSSTGRARGGDEPPGGPPRSRPPRSGPPRSGPARGGPPGGGPPKRGPGRGPARGGPPRGGPPPGGGRGPNRPGRGKPGRGGPR